MFNPFLLLYFIAHLFLLLASAAVVFHLIKYQLNHSATVITTGLFLSGAAILLVINLVLASRVPWNELNVVF